MTDIDATQHNQHNYIVTRINKNDSIDIIGRANTYNEAKSFVISLRENDSFEMGEFINIYKVYDVYSADLRKCDITKKEKTKKKDNKTK